MHPSLPLSNTGMLPLLPFDAHNHVHMGPTWPLSHNTLTTVHDEGKTDVCGISRRNENDPSPACADLLDGGSLSGMAVMSTHPRDFDLVLELARSSGQRSIPCVGVHPWFLHELDENDWQIIIPKEANLAHSPNNGFPRWTAEMEELLLKHPNMPVGEIGLDGFHFDPTTKALTSPMETQIKALELQLNLAIRLQRPVSMHCVRAMGPMMDTIAKVQKANKGKLPPAMYFHAFGGKAATATQLVKTLEKKGATRLYFGFAPVINFESPKTIQVIEEVGLDRLVLETDHEDASLVASSMKLGVQVISKIFGISPDKLIGQTNQNARKLYGITEPK